MTKKIKPIDPKINKSRGTLILKKSIFHSDKAAGREDEKPHKWCIMPPDRIIIKSTSAIKGIYAK
ncbi:MAG: hypothetical protein ACI8R9_002029 [Paraglaciecola sp.]|jgi:hypothetical protein